VEDSVIQRTLTAAGLALALAACGQKSKSDPYLAAVPDAAALTIDTAPTATAAGTIDPIHVTTFGDDLGVVHAKAKALNDGLRQVFSRLEEVAASGGNELPGNVKTYGPAVRCVERDAAGACVAQADLQLVVKLYSDTKSGFLLRVRDGQGTYSPVLAGYLLHGTLGRRGAGRLWVNLDNLAAAAGAGYRGRGLLAAGFAAGPIAKRAGYMMVQFTPDTAEHDQVTAAFRMWKNAAGTVRARVAGFGDLDTSGPSLELGIWRGVWSPIVGGRSFTFVSNFDSNGSAPGGTIVGDVAPAGTLDGYWFGRACYAPGQPEAKFKEWYRCSRPSGPLACIAGAPASDHQIVIDTGSAGSWSAACGLDAAGLVAPAGAPGSDADDLSPEEDEAQAYVEPEACPSDARTPADTSPPGMGGGMGMGM
jgi:hypothetical protein